MTTKISVSPFASTAGMPNSAVAEDIRGRIVRGEYALGARLPTQRQMTRDFDTTKVTIQRAFEILIEQGFITTEGTRGTFVSQHPPHLTRYAVVFPSAPGGEAGTWSSFYRAIREATKQVRSVPGRELPFFYGVDFDRRGADYHQLVREVQESRVAGIIFAADPGGLQGTPLLDEIGLPRVTLAPTQWLPHVPTVYPDARAFVERAARYLRSQGRQRVAVLMPAHYEALSSLGRGNLAPCLEATGLTSQRYWLQQIDIRSAHSARDLAHLLFNTNQRERPDALIIADDHLVASVGEGLMEAGVRIPEQLSIVAQCNFPFPPSCPVPMRTLGFDARQFPAACIESVDQQRLGRLVPPETLIPPRWEFDTPEPIGS